MKIRNRENNKFAVEVEAELSSFLEIMIDDRVDVVDKMKRVDGVDKVDKVDGVDKSNGFNKYREIALA